MNEKLINWKSVTAFYFEILTLIFLLVLMAFLGDAAWRDDPIEWNKLLALFIWSNMPTLGFTVLTVVALYDGE